jgi:hypothetical protein
MTPTRGELVQHGPQWGQQKGVTRMRFETQSEIDRERQRLADEKRFDEAARTLPADLFRDDEEVGPLMREVEELERPLRLVHHLRTSGRLEEVKAVLASKVQRGRQALREAALDDALAGRFDFPAASGVAERIMEIEWQLEAAQAAIEAAASPRVDPSPNLEAVRRKLGEALQSKRREYLRQHPDLLKQYPDNPGRAVIEMQLQARESVQDAADDQ